MAAKLRFLKLLEARFFRTKNEKLKAANLEVHRLTMEVRSLLTKGKATARAAEAPECESEEGRGAT